MPESQVITPQFSTDAPVPNVGYIQVLKGSQHKFEMQACETLLPGLLGQETFGKLGKINCFGNLSGIYEKFMRDRRGPSSCKDVLMLFESTRLGVPEMQALLAVGATVGLFSLEIDHKYRSSDARSSDEPESPRKNSLVARMTFLIYPPSHEGYFEVVFTDKDRDFKSPEMKLHWYPWRGEKRHLTYLAVNVVETCNRGYEGD